MTRSDMLAYLLKHASQSPQLLGQVYGDEWIDPMIGLIDLGLVNTYENRDQVTIFQVVGWLGRGVTPNRSTREVMLDKEIYAHQTNGHKKEAFTSEARATHPRRHHGSP